MPGKLSWIADKHLTDDELLILAGSHCSAAIKEAAFAHLRKCQSCCTRLESTRQARSALIQILDRGLLNDATPQRSTTKPAFPRLPTLALFGASILALAVMFHFQTLTVVKAATILHGAIQNENSLVAPAIFRFSVAGQPCGRGLRTVDVASANSSSTCTEGIALMRRVEWTSQTPLSAKAFSGWRDSLQEKKDTIIQQADSVKLHTVTPTGVLREASLTVRAADYHPIALDLVFENDQEISFSEDDAVSVVDLASVQPYASEPHGNIARTLIANPLDEAEVSAWELLGQLHADTGWEATVIRQDDTIELKARAANAAREQEFRDALQENGAVKLKIESSAQSTTIDPFLAERRLTGDSPALAHDWLEQQFPDVEDRSKFTNNVLALSKTVLGRAFYLEQLHRSRTRMVASASGQRLAEIIAHQEDLLVTEQTALAVAIHPLVGSPKRPVTTLLSYAEATRLDDVLGALLAASTQDTRGYTDEMEAVRELL